MSRMVLGLEGKRFGKLTVMNQVTSNKKIQTFWSCVCDCGNTKVVAGSRLNKGINKSCGCGSRELKYSVEIGKRYGHLVVIKSAGSKSNRRIWECICDCGKTTTRTSKSIVCSKNKDGANCGCSKPSNLKLIGKAGLDRTYATYNISAKKRNLIFELTKDRFKEIIQQNCHYCNSPPTNEYKARNNAFISLDDKRYLYNGIDRIDSKDGYYESNIVPCCKRCNIAKNTMGYGEFIGWVQSIYFHTLKQEGVLKNVI